MPTNYPTEFKIKAIRRYEKGESLKALSQELNVAQSTLYQWRNTYCSIQAPNRTYTPAGFDAISRWLQRLENETQIIRLTGFLEKVPLQEKLAALEQIYYQTDGLYSRKIVGWRVSRHMSTNLVTTTFKRAFQERGNPKNLTFHSDRGSQYISKTFAGCCSVSKGLHFRTALPAKYSRVYSVLQ